MADASVEGEVPAGADERSEASVGETAVSPAQDAPATGAGALAPKARPAAIPVHEAPEVEPDDQDEEPPVGHEPDDLGEDGQPAASVAEVDDEEVEAEDGQEDVAGDTADEDGPLPPAPPATEVEETTLIPKVTEPRAGESTTALSPVSAPAPGLAHRQYTSAPVGYAGRAAGAAWGSSPLRAGAPDTQPDQVRPTVPESEVESTRVQPSARAVPPQFGTARGYQPLEFDKVDPQRAPHDFKLDRREFEGDEGSKKLTRRALLAGGGIAVAAAVGLTATGVVELPGTTPKMPTAGFAPATGSGASFATQTGTAFLTAWQNGQFEQAANITDNPTEALEALTWYEKNLGVVGLVFNPNGADAVGWMTFAITTQAGSPMGQWQYQSGFATYSKQIDGYTRWFVQWTPEILYASLKSGYELKIKKTPASVKGVVDRNGTLIDTTAHPSLASLVNVLKSKAVVAGATDGQQIIMVDAKGNQVATVATLTDPINNGTVQSTLDMNVQSAADTAVTMNPQSSMVAIQPSTGHILAIANYTTKYYDDDALLARVAPGSTFKIITSAALLNAGMVTASSDAPCPATLTITNNVLHNSGGESGDYTYGEDFAKSCNNAFSSFYDHSGMTANLLAHTAKTYFGLNQQWDIGVGESAQYMTVQENLSGAGLAESLVGQDQIVACPLAMCSVAATVANGSFKQPIVVPNQTQITATPLPSATQSALKSMMSDVIDSSIGTAYGVAFPHNGHFHGKTGTAEVGSGPGLYNNAWFVVFDDQHDLCVGALVIKGTYGASTAAPECLHVFQKLGYA